MPLSTSTAERAVERGLADRFALVRRIADDLAHELKNPLNAMVINLELLRTRVSSGRTDEALERLDVVVQETRRLHVLLEQVLRLLRPETPGAAGDFPLAALLAEVEIVATVLAGLARRGFELRPVPADLRVRGRPEPFRFGLLSLIDAALRPLPGELGPVVLETMPGVRGTDLLLSAPAATAPALRAALPAAARLLGEADVALAAALEEGGCSVRVALAAE